jgi:hypothetical protein
MSSLGSPLEEISAAASVVVPSTVATEGIQVVTEDPITDMRNAFLSLVFGPLPPPILAMPGSRRTRAPTEVATTVVASRNRSRSERMLQLRSCSRALWVSWNRMLSLMTTPLPPSTTSLRPLCRLSHHDAWLPCEEDGEGEKAQRQKGRRQEEGD